MKFNIFTEQINWNEWNNGKEKVLFLHGFASNHTIINSLKKYNLNVDIVAFDFPGCGGSSANTQNASLTYYLEVAKEFIKQIGYKFKFVVGHSMGCDIALNLLKENIVENCILLSPLTYELNNDNINIEENLLPFTIEQSEQCLLNLFYKPPQALLRILRDQAQRNLNYVSFRRNYYMNMVHNQIINNEYIKNRTIQVWENKLDHITIIVGKQDNYITLKSMQKISNKHKVKLYEVDRAGHAIMSEQPEEITLIINSLINGKI